MTANPSRSERLVRLGDWALLALLLVVAGILTAAIALQYGFGEVPCPLCLLQRIAMFGICFGVMRYFRQSDRTRSIGLGLVSALVLLIVAGRQTLLDICPLPGRSYIGSAVLGLHMPVWSVVVALATLAALTLHLVVIGESRAAGDEPSSKLAGWAGIYVAALCAINLASAVLQCGFGQCHTTGYALL
jgi:disulfide bond formation protein DsbB